MLFNSIDFALFVPITFILYWYVFNKSIKWQNLFVVIASYWFYGVWNWKFLGLIFFSTVIDFFSARFLFRYSSEFIRKTILSISIISNLGFLGFFKYYNFFIENFNETFTLLGLELHLASLQIILPVGISFYTFQTISYTFDVYRKKLEPTSDFIAFAAYVSFFPQLVAGPIERAVNFLPQFYQQRIFNREKAVDGLRQILWGLFKKIVIADGCAFYVNQIFNNYTTNNGSSLLFAVVLFNFQLYGDFSGYSDIAIGTARLFGFNLRQNFAFPYFSRNMAEFYRRWHISLSSWFREYFYIPMGGSRGSKLKILRNTFVIFIVSGVWHGANWTYIIWGLINAFYFLPLIFRKKNRKYMDVVAFDRKYPSFNDVILLSTTFFLSAFSRIFFRSESVSKAIEIFNKIFSYSLFELPDYEQKKKSIIIIFLVIVFVFIEWLGRRNKHALEILPVNMKRVYRRVFYYGLILIIFLFGGEQQQFIYFQF